MAKDVKALGLLRKEMLKLDELLDPPKELDKIEGFKNKWSQHMEGTVRLFNDITIYTKAIQEQMEVIRANLNKSSEKVQQRILDIIDSIERKYFILSVTYHINSLLHVD